MFAVVVLNSNFVVNRSSFVVVAAVVVAAAVVVIVCCFSWVAVSRVDVIVVIGLLFCSF